MTQLSALSFWGIALVVVAFAAVLALLTYVDRKLMGRVVRVLLYFLGSLLLAGCYTWGLVRLNRWWACGLWLLVLSVLVGSLVLHRARLPWRRLLLPVATAVAGGLLTATTLLSLCFAGGYTTSVAMASMMVQACVLLPTVSAALQAYVGSLRHTDVHCRYMLASGATHLETIRPSFVRSIRASLLPVLRRAVLPVVVTPPLFWCGLLLAGTSPLLAVVIALVAFMSAVVAVVVTTLLALCLCDRRLFGANGTLSL